jgi:hypothetical protein
MPMAFSAPTHSRVAQREFSSARPILRACPRVGENWEVLRARLRFGGLAVVDARIGNTRVMAIIDTGAERSLGNPALLAASGLQAQADDPQSRKQVFAATSQAVFGNLVATPSIRLGGLEVTNLQVVFGDFEAPHGAGDQPYRRDILITAPTVDYRREEFASSAGRRTQRAAQRVVPTRISQRTGDTSCADACRLSFRHQ